MVKIYQPNQINEIVEILKNDGVISIATDTVFGVCARMTSIDAQENLRKVKNRPQDKAFPIMCSDLDQVKRIAHVGKREERIIERFMPGPLTLVLNKKEEVEDFVNGGMATLAIRLATSDTLRQIITLLDEPIYMTSANQSGMPVCTSIEDIQKQCPLLDGIVESKPSFGLASTIVDCTKKDLIILREGPISLEELKSI